MVGHIKKVKIVEKVENFLTFLICFWFPLFKYCFNFNIFILLFNSWKTFYPSSSYQIVNQDLIRTLLCTFNKIRNYTGGYAVHWGASALFVLLVLYSISIYLYLYIPRVFSRIFKNPKQGGLKFYRNKRDSMENHKTKKKRKQWIIN